MTSPDQPGSAPPRRHGHGPTASLAPASTALRAPASPAASNPSGRRSIASSGFLPNPVSPERAARATESSSPASVRSAIPAEARRLPFQPGPIGGRRRRTHLQRSSRRWSRAIIWSLIALAGFGVTYGSVARIETSISANGRLRPVGGSFELIPPFTAPIRRVLVRDGDHVKAGQPLLELDGENAARQWRELADLRRLWQQEANQAALQLGLPAVPLEGPEQRLALGDQLRDMALRRRAADQRRLRSEATIREQSAELEALRRKRAINANIQSRMEGLVRQGAISRLELDRQEERNVELDGMIHRGEQQLEAARRDLGESEANLAQLVSGNRRLLYGESIEARRQLLETSSQIGRAHV